MPTLTFQNARTTIENAVIDQLSLAHGARLPSAATIAALRGRATQGLSEEEASLIYVTSKALVYRWRPFDTTSDDGDGYVRPADVESDKPGRWVKTDSDDDAGYLQSCVLFNEEESIQQMLEHISGRTPALLLTYQGTDFQPRSLIRGALYWAEYHFALYAISVSMRMGQSARQGSGLSSEAAIDPGTAAMLGDAKKSLAGSDLGLSGVAFTDIKSEATLLKDLHNAQFVEVLEFTVKASIHNTEDASELVTLGEIGELTVQRQLLDGDSLDLDNYVTSGYRISVGAGFTKSPSAGTAKIDGDSVSSSPAAHTFSENKDIYRDLKTDGTFVYHEVDHGQDPPELANHRLRVGVTVTDGVGVIWDSMIAPHLEDFGSVDIVESAGVGAASIAITPTTGTVVAGGTVQLTATASYSSGSTEDISAVCDWVSTDDSVATVDASGLVTGVASGSASITCSYDGLAAGNSSAITVS